MKMSVRLGITQLNFDLVLRINPNVQKLHIEGSLPLPGRHEDSDNSEGRHFVFSKQREVALTQGHRYGVNTVREHKLSRVVYSQVLELGSIREGLGQEAESDTDDRSDPRLVQWHLGKTNKGQENTKRLS